MRRLGVVAILVFLTFPSGMASAQSVLSYDTCTALANAAPSIDVTPVANSSVTDTVNIATLFSGDRIVISISRFGDAGNTTAIDINGATPFFSATYTSVDSGSPLATTHYDAPATQTSVSLNLVSGFTGTALGLTYGVTCIPGAGPSTPQSVTSAFLAERIRRVLEEEPDRPRMVRKRLDALWGGAGGTAGAVGGMEQPLAFSASRKSIRAHGSLSALAHFSPGGISGTPVGGANWSAAKSIVVTPASDLPPDPQIEPLSPLLPVFGCWDLWTEAHYTWFNDSGGRRGDYAIGYAGLDCQIHASMIVGFLGQVDWMDDKIGIANTSTDGIGWMIGPYATMRLTPDLFLDLRGAWGRSDNDIEIGAANGNFDTNRWLVSGRLTGNFILKDFRITPEVSVAYIEENQRSYTLSNGLSVGKQTVGLGRLKFGPEIARRFLTSSGTVVEPHAALRGLWDFAATDVTIGGTRFSQEGFRGIAELGVIVQRPDRINFRAAAKYDGIGAAGFDAYGGQVWINVPLN